MYWMIVVKEFREMLTYHNCVQYASVSLLEAPDSRVVWRLLVTTATVRESPLLTETIHLNFYQL